MDRIKAIISNQGLKRYFLNTLWLYATQGVRLLAGFFIGLWVARFLGPTEFGIYNYVISFIAIFSAFASFGTNEQLVTELVGRPEHTQQILNASFHLRTVLGLVSILTIYIIALVTDDSAKFYLYISAPIILFQTFDLIDVYYRATVNAKTSSMIRILQILISSALKIYCIQSQAPLTYFFYIFVFDYGSYAILIYLSYKKINDGFILLKPHIEEIRRIIFNCWPLMLMAISNNILSKLDQVLIGKYLVSTNVGYYAVSSRLVELFGTFPLLAFSSLFTAILNAKKSSQIEYEKRLKHLSRFLRWASLLGAVFTYYFSSEIIITLFGSSFAPSAEILKIHSLNFLFLTMSIVSMHWYIAEGKNNYLMIKTVIAGIFSILINMLLIPHFGIKGAAVGSVITHFIFYYAYDFINPKTRQCFYLNSDLFSFIFKK
ncbi:flippase [Peredibacter sp. HCB2-198]|uniref:flippase n=1 Tax=Peredibacter sp. HCB2-198 TaxID=3383025 RepID=UPI0038B59847